jgi:hypothetical protein
MDMSVTCACVNGAVVSGRQQPSLQLGILIYSVGERNIACSPLDVLWNAAGA